MSFCAAVPVVSRALGAWQCVVIDRISQVTYRVAHLRANSGSSSKNELHILPGESPSFLEIMFNSPGALRLVAERCYNRSLSMCSVVWPVCSGYGTGIVKDEEDVPCDRDNLSSNSNQQRLPLRRISVNLVHGRDMFLHGCKWPSIQWLWQPCEQDNRQLWARNLSIFWECSLGLIILFYCLPYPWCYCECNAFLWIYGTSRARLCRPTPIYKLIKYVVINMTHTQHLLTGPAAFI